MGFVLVCGGGIKQEREGGAGQWEAAGNYEKSKAAREQTGSGRTADRAGRYHAHLGWLAGNILRTRSSVVVVE